MAGRSELRVSPRPALLTRTFGAHAIFLATLVVPISVYFYVFHGDWYLLYLVDVRRVPSAFALLSFMAHGAIGSGGFLAGASLIRAQKEVVAALLGSGPLVGAVAFGVLARSRLAVVGSYAQFHRGFGLKPFAESALLEGAALMTLVLVVGLLALVFRIHWGTRRGA